MADTLTTNDVLDIIKAQASWCREEGESDMRYILHLIESIREKIDAGMSRADALEHFSQDEED